MRRAAGSMLWVLLTVYAAMAVFTALVYRADLAATAGAVGGGFGLLVLAIGVAWASNARS